MISISIRLQWDSDRSLPKSEIEYNGHYFALEIVEGEADIRVFDATRWENFDEAKSRYTVASKPTMVICRDQDEAQWLSELPPDQGFCRESRFEGQFAHLVVRLSARNHEWKKLMRRSLADPLTGVLPRSEWDRRLGLEIVTVSEDDPLALLLLDLDHFKNVNDEYGHTAGDKVLKTVGGILNGSLSGEPNVYRVAGEEFALLVRMNRTQAVALGDFIRKEVEEHPFAVRDTTIRVTASIGIAINSGQRNKEQFITEADTALYQAKALGRNRVVEYDSFSAQVVENSGDPAIKDFENRIRVLTERLTGSLTQKSRQMVSLYKREADHDGLTGLYVRRYFDKRMPREFEAARNKVRPLSLIFLDIDHFGQVNKTHGFPTGDHALQRVAEVIKNSVRDVDWAARYGGEEFCVILPDTDENHACEIAERIWEGIGDMELTAFDGTTFRLTASLGISELAPEDRRIKDFIQRTGDRTLYAKEHGRNQLCCRNA